MGAVDDRISTVIRKAAEGTECIIRERYQARGASREWVGIIGSINHFALFLVEVARLDMGLAEQLADVVSQDSMGRSHIFYFPGFTVQPGGAGYDEPDEGA